MVRLPVSTSHLNIYRRYGRREGGREGRSGRNAADQKGSYPLVPPSPPSLPPSSDAPRDPLPSDILEGEKNGTYTLVFQTDSLPPLGVGR